VEANRLRIGAGILALAAAVIVFIVLQNDNGDDSSSAGNPPVAVIDIKGGKPVGGIRQLTYTKGQLMRIKVNSDVSDEVHLHGYDIPKDVEAGGSVTFRVPAAIEGGFEMELESRKEQIAEIKVQP
jgi:hypothetical protein